MINTVSNIFKKMFCEHEYKYYFKNKEFFISGYFDCFHFVCKKCGKTKRLFLKDIIAKYDEFRVKYARHIAIGGQKIEPTLLEFPTGTTSYFSPNNPATTLLHEHYLKQGIDLKQLSCEKPLT